MFIQQWNCLIMHFLSLIDTWLFIKALCKAVCEIFWWYFDNFHHVHGKNSWRKDQGSNQKRLGSLWLPFMVPAGSQMHSFLSGSFLPSPRWWGCFWVGDDISAVTWSNCLLSQGLVCNNCALALFLFDKISILCTAADHPTHFHSQNPVLSAGALVTQQLENCWYSQKSF